jgi:spore coat polysaccharide biosynthesis predicted glycosyltransferase SpsG
VHIVATAGRHEGRGHAARAVTMAEALIAAGATVRLELLRGSLTPGEAERLTAVGADVAGADVVGPDAGGAARVDSLAKAGENADAILVDLPDPNEVAGRFPPDRVAVFDDREWLRGSAALVVQPSSERWTGQADAGQVLAGYRFAPIRPSLRRLAAEQARETGAERGPDVGPPSVVVCFGGSDPEDVGGRLVPAIADASSWATTAVIGFDYRGSLSPGRAGAFEVLRDPADLDRRLARAGLVVSGGGTMKFELALLGRPLLMAAVVDDQLPVAPPFAATGAARYLGDGRTIAPEIAASSVAELIDDEAARESLSARGPSVVDGGGADRISEALLALAASRPK